MTTNVAIIANSLRLIGVIGETETPSAEQGAGALAALNQLMEAWSEDCELGYYAQSVMSAACPVPAWAEAGVISKLAIRLLADYPSQTQTAYLSDESINGIGLIRRKSMTDKLRGANMNHMPMGEGQWPTSRARILTGD